MIGGDTWQEKSNQPILEVANSFLEKNILAAAICGATLGLANKGILNLYYHTSNALFF
ncbi:DJ-1/PfpI family protein [Gemella morbillorum]|uniref:DJ-1/PfpI family protein n=1 Tax=Gemella morbillorum TaxID=29391 RepID=UPI0028D21D3B|nr:DJ-1/PfpI family protein [Gemella morbillorum]